MLSPQRTKFIRHGDLAPGICATLVQNVFSCTKLHFLKFVPIHVSKINTCDTTQFFHTNFRFLTHNSQPSSTL